MKERLQGEVWPGNVRELRNALERAMILADGNVLRSEHLWLESSGSASSSSSVPERASAPPARAGGSLADLERETIESTLLAVGGNRRAAAAKLGIGLRTLYDKLKRYNLR
jgi:DNA-binding NtrC family response regulator